MPRMWISSGLPQQFTEQFILNNKHEYCHSHFKMQMLQLQQCQALTRMNLQVIVAREYYEDKCYSPSQSLTCINQFT